MNFKKILSNSALVLVGDVFERILRLVLVVFSARLLGDVAYGKFTFALAFTSLFLILADGGIHQLLVREIARTPEKGKQYVANALVLKCILSALTLSLMLTIAQFTGKTSDVLMAVYIMGAALIVSSFSEFCTSVIRAHQEMKYDVVATILFGTLVAGIGLTVLFSGYDFITLSYVYLFSHLVRLVYLIIVLHSKFIKFQLRFHLPTVSFLVREGFPFGILFFFALMYTYIDSTMLSLMIGDQAVGWYNASYRLVFAMMFIPVAAMKAVFPALSLYYKESDEAFKALFERSFKVMFLVGFALASLIFVLADRIVIVVFGEEYAAAAGALKILVWSTAIIFIGTVQTHTTRASNRQGFTAKVVATSAALNVVLNFFLIPKYSLNGAAFATLAAEFFTFVCHGIYLTRRIAMPPVFKLAPKIVVICLVSGLYVTAINGLSLLVIFPTSVAVVAAMAFLTRYFSKDEIEFARSLIRTPGRFAIT